MNSRLLAWIPPVIVALAPLVHWGEDFRYSRFAILLAGLSLAWLLRPLHRLSGKLVALLAAGPALAAVSWAVNGFPTLSPIAMAEMMAAWAVLVSILADDAPQDYAASWSLAMTGASIYGLMQLLQVVPLPLDGYGQPDPASTFGLSNFAAESLVVSIPVAVGLFLTTGSRWLRALLPPAIVMQMLFLLFADSRAGWIAFSVALVVVVAVWRPEDRRLYWGVFLLLVLFVATFAGLGRDRLNLMSETDPSLVFRREAWKASLLMSEQKPITGVGPGRFPAEVGNYSNEKLTNVSVRVRRSIHHPHNEFLNVLAERGVLGLLWLLGVIGAAAAAFWRRRAAWPLAGLAAGVTVAMFGFPMQQAPFWAAIAILTGLGLKATGDSQETAMPPAKWVRAGGAMVLLAVTVLFGIRAQASDLSRRAIVALDLSGRIAGTDEDRAEILRAKAAENLRGSLALWREDPETVFNLSQATSFPEEKVTLLRTYLQWIPGDVLARITLAQAQVLARDKPGAEATLLDVISRANAPMDAFHRLVSLYVSDGKHEEAAGIAMRGLARFPGNKQLLIDAGDARRLGGDPVAASQFYDQLLLENPSEPGFYLRAGVTQMTLENYAKAETIFKRGHELAPRDPAFMVYLAQLENASDRINEAKAHLLEALKYDPNLANNLKEIAPELIPLINELKKNG